MKTSKYPVSHGTFCVGNCCMTLTQLDNDWWEFDPNYLGARGTARDCIAELKIWQEIDADNRDMVAVEQKVIQYLWNCIDSMLYMERRERFADAAEKLYDECGDLAIYRLKYLDDTNAGFFNDEMNSYREGLGMWTEEGYRNFVMARREARQ